MKKKRIEGRIKGQKEEEKDRRKKKRTEGRRKGQKEEEKER